MQHIVQINGHKWRKRAYGGEESEESAEKGDKVIRKKREVKCNK